MEINYKGLTYYFEKEDNENEEMFYERCWKAVTLSSNPPNTEKELNNNIKYSKLLINKLYYKCCYSPEIEEKLKLFVK